MHPHIAFRTCLSIWNSIRTFCFPAKYRDEQRTTDDGRAWCDCGSHFPLLCSTETEKLPIGWNRLMSKMPSRHLSHHNIAKLMMLLHPYGLLIDCRHFSYPIRLLFIYIKIDGSLCVRWPKLKNKTMVEIIGIIMQSAFTCLMCSKTPLSSLSGDLGCFKASICSLALSQVWCSR